MTDHRNRDFYSYKHSVVKTAIAMNGELYCNSRKCRKPLTNGQAWVTSCSHIFCKEDGENIIAQERKICPSCEHQLNNKLDIVRMEMNPSENYKNMVLCGQRPEAIMDICSRALNFWTFQNRQEHMYKNNKLSKFKDKFEKLNVYSTKMVSNWQLESDALNTKLHHAKNELQTSNRRCEEYNAMLQEKSRQVQSLQSSLNMQRYSTMCHAERPIRDTDVTFSNFDIPVGMSNPVTPSPRSKNNSRPFEAKTFLFNAGSYCNSPVLGRSGQREPRSLFSQPQSPQRL
ncbi:E3 ubiquitin-protein ligase CCNB1IP1-like isoform X1 [Clavelina lepadiformis]|uniref:E3 ubiquitin-protein ligase CCNB1IP1-like isoform X1 n=2 Tax=Clavelina lepadiformis TaxID=159417 RepID=UPI0040430F7A